MQKQQRTNMLQIATCKQSTSPPDDEGSVENEDPENEDPKTRRPITTLRKRRPTTKTKIPSFLARLKRKTDRVI